MEHKIVEVVLFTNRTTFISYENGEMVHDIQTVFSWKPVEPYNDYKCHCALRQIIEDKPVFLLVKWNEWQHEITADEFCSLVGYGPWYWDNYKANYLTPKEEVLKEELINENT